MAVYEVLNWILLEFPNKIHTLVVSIWLKRMKIQIAELFSFLSFFQRFLGKLSFSLKLELSRICILLAKNTIHRSVTPWSEKKRFTVNSFELQMLLSSLCANLYLSLHDYSPKLTCKRFNWAFYGVSLTLIAYYHLKSFKTPWDENGTPWDEKRSFSTIPLMPHTIMAYFRPRPNLQ